LFAGLVQDFECGGDFLPLVLLYLEGVVVHGVNCPPELVRRSRSWVADFRRHCPVGADLIAEFPTATLLGSLDSACHIALSSASTWHPG
jgi:hypothetical protein